MTTPGGSPPDGAYVVGDKFGSDVTEDSVRAITRGAIGGFEEAQGAWHDLVSDLDLLVGEVNDGQIELNDRLDLLEGVYGYCSLFMSANWQLAPNLWLTLPFDTQLGPKKGADLFNSGIKLATKGLWRADAHVSFYAGGGTFTAAVLVSVVRASTDEVFTEHRFDLVITPSGPETAAFSHTFVIPDDDAFYVRVQARHAGGGRRGVYGGTLRSALSVNKWDSGTNNLVVLPSAPDGGDLG